MTALAIPLLMPSWLDPYAIIQSSGPWALWIVAFIIFAECGLFAILPGDSLLFAVGMLTAMGVRQGEPPVIHYFGSKPATLLFVMAVLMVAAVAGNLCGYYLGRLIGPPLFKPRKGLMGKAFDPKHVDRTQAFFDRYGAKALVLARFVPLVRTFVTMIAGIGRMNLRRFIGYTAIGGVAWVLIITLAGYLLGNVAFVKDHIEMVLVAIVAVSLVPMLIEYLNGRRRARTASSPADVR